MAKRTKSEEIEVDGLPFSMKAFVDLDGPNVAFEIRLADFVDSYDYHDFPASEIVYLDESKLKALTEALQAMGELIQKMKSS